VTQPQSVPADGNLRVYYLATLADPNNPTLAELNAGTSKDLSCYITGDGFVPTLDEQSVTDNRLCSRATYERPGRWQKQMTLSYVINPASPANNVAYLTLGYLVEGFIIARWGVPFETPWAAAQLGDLYPIQCGKPLKNQVAENTVITCTQKLFITAESLDDVVVAA
jgi:hypothetical protein